MSYQKITLKHQTHIAFLTLNHPDSNNAIDAVMANELEEVVQELNQTDEVRVIIVSGIGENFSSDSQITHKSASMPTRLATDAVADLSVPIIAAIQGEAIGQGLELALACDIRVASDESKFSLPQAKYGQIPAGGGTQRLARIVGKGKALELILTGEIINAREAFQIGMVNRVISRKELWADVTNMAEKLASKAPIAARYAKEAINQGLDMSLSQGLKLEADLSFLLHTTKDRTEGINAFKEKRAAEFKGE